MHDRAHGAAPVVASPARSARLGGSCRFILINAPVYAPGAPAANTQTGDLDRACRIAGVRHCDERSDEAI
jgi:hypothetical protein